MISVFICDDEPKMLSDISQITRITVPECEILEFLSGAELIKMLTVAYCDILLIDIDMPEIGGLEIAERLFAVKPKPLLVFVTSHDELVYDSLQFHPFGFVRKSYIQTELPKTLSDCVYELGSKEKHFVFHTTAGEIKLSLYEILYFEANGNYLRIVTTHNEHRFRETLSSAEKSFSDSGFVRIHKGFLINQAAVRMIMQDEVELVNGEKLPIGKSFSKSAKKSLMRYIMK